MPARGQTYKLGPNTNATKTTQLLRSKEVTLRVKPTETEQVYKPTNRAMYHSFYCSFLHPQAFHSCYPISCLQRNWYRPEDGSASEKTEVRDRAWKNLYYVERDWRGKCQHCTLKDDCKNKQTNKQQQKVNINNHEQQKIKQIAWYNKFE